MPSTLPQTSTTSFDEEIDSRSFRSLETASTLTLHADPFTHVDANHNAASDDEDAAGVKIAKASPPLPGMEQLKRQVQHIEDVFFVAPTGLESRLTVSDFRSLFDLLLYATFFHLYCHTDARLINVPCLQHFRANRRAAGSQRPARRPHFRLDKRHAEHSARPCRYPHRGAHEGRPLARTLCSGTPVSVLPLVPHRQS
ncbi:hypothetical protein BDW22DRAFT_877272 [Trametopsis cervina]|nr:hypothetical protein BDW22DRAFT_877272 [Trametopsis cervina]